MIPFKSGINRRSLISVHVPKSQGGEIHCAKYWKKSRFHGLRHDISCEMASVSTETCKEDSLTEDVV